MYFFFFSSRRRHTRWPRDWSSDVCSSDLLKGLETLSYLGKSEDHKTNIKTVSESYRKATMKTLSFAFLSSFALDFFTSLSIAFVAVGFGLRLIDGVILLLPALTILILAPEYYSPIK